MENYLADLSDTGSSAAGRDCDGRGQNAIPSILLNELMNIKNTDINTMQLLPSPFNPLRSGMINGNLAEERGRSGSIGEILDILRQDNLLKRIDTCAQQEQKIEQAQFARLGEKAAAMLKEYGVQSVELEHQGDRDCLKLNFARELELERAGKKVSLDKVVSADLRQLADGRIILENIDGMKVKVKVFGLEKELEIDSMSFKDTGAATELKLECFLGAIPFLRTLTVDRSVYEKAVIMKERLRKL